MSQERDRSPVDRRGRRHSDDRGKANDCKLFVSNFPYEVRKQELKDLFEEKIGNVVDAEMFQDENGRPRGCGLVEFSSADAAKDALRRMDRFDWRGRKLSCKRASDKDRDEFGRLIGNKGRAGGGGGNHDSRVYVSNLPYEMKWQDVKDLFRDHVGESSYVELFNDENGKPRGCGILEFNSAELAQKAIRKLNKFEVKGRKILVQEALDHERDKYGYIIKGGSRGRTDRRDRTPERRRSRDRDRSPSDSASKDMGYTYGLSVEFLESLGIRGPLQTKVFVANLAFSVDDEKLREVFRLAGRIVRAEVNKDREGKSRGYGLVEYTHPVEAVQAISMFKDQKLYDRMMHVRFDRDLTPEETRLPNRLPEGLEGIGMGLGSGGKPLTDVLKSLQQISETTTAKEPEPALTPSAKTLAELTPALALLAQQMNLAATVAQTPNLNAMGSAGIFNTLNPGAGMMNTGFNNPAQAAPQPQAQVPTGFGSNLASGQGFGGQQGFGNMGGGANMGAGQAAMNNMGQNQISQNLSSMGGLNGAQSQLGPANNAAGYAMRNAPGAGMDRNRAPPPVISRNPNMPDNSTRFNPSAVPNPFSAGDGQNRGAWDTIIVRNLPADLDWQELRDFFESCGDVKNAMIKERGVGLVRFTTERSAENALTYDSTMKWGRLLDVRIY